MQTLWAYFLEQEMPEIREAISTMDNIEILSETKEPDSDLYKVTMLMVDASMLYTVGALVQNSRYQKVILQSKPDLENLANNFFNSIKTDK